MEDALIEMRKRNDELVRANHLTDAIDSPVSPKFLTTNEQVLQLKDELNRREVAHNERIVEMVCIQSITNSYIRLSLCSIVFHAHLICSQMKMSHELCTTKNSMAVYENICEKMQIYYQFGVDVWTNVCVSPQISM